LAYGLAEEIVKNYSELASNCGRDYLPSGLDVITRLIENKAMLARYLEMRNLMSPFFNTTRWTIAWDYRFSGDAAEYNLKRFKNHDVAVHWYPDR